MKYCHQCGSPLPDDAAFCGQCGAAVPKEAPKPSFCSSCGAQLPPSASVCPDCGAPVTPRAPQQTPPAQAPAAPAGRKKSFKVPLIIGLSLVLVAAIAVGGIFLAKALTGPSPKDFIDYQTQLLESRLPSDVKVPDPDDMTLDTDITLSASADNPEISSYLNGSSITLKLKADKDDALVNGLVTLMGSNVLSATVTYDDGMLGLYLPELDTNYYVFDLKAFAERLGQQMEMYGGYSSGELQALLSDDSLDIAALSDYLEENLDAEQLKKLAEPYLAIARGFFNEERITIEKDVTVPMAVLDGSVEKATVYTFAPQAEDIEQALNALADQLGKDEQLHDFLLDLINNNETIHDTVAQALWESAGIDISTLDGLITTGQAQLASELRQQIPYIVQVFRQNITAKWTLAVAGKTVRRISLEATNRAYNETLGIGYEMNDQNGSRTEMIFVNTGYGPMPLMQLTSSKSGDMNNYDFLAYLDDTSESLGLSCSIDQKKVSPLGCPYGSYSVTVNDYGDYLTLKMDVQDGAGGGTDHVLSISGSPYMFDGMFSYMSVTVNATDKSSAVKPSQSPVDITNYSFDQIGTILENMGDACWDIIYNLSYYAW